MASDASVARDLRRRGGVRRTTLGQAAVTSSARGVYEDRGGRVERTPRGMLDTRKNTRTTELGRRTLGRRHGESCSENRGDGNREELHCEAIESDDGEKANGMLHWASEFGSWEL